MKVFFIIFYIYYFAHKMSDNLFNKLKRLECVICMGENPDIFVICCGHPMHQ